MKMSSFVYQRPLHNPLSNSDPSSSSPHSSSSPTKNTSKIFNKPTLLIITLSLFIFIGLVIFSTSLPLLSLSSSSSSSKWNRYTLSEAAAYVANNGTVIVCAVSGPYLPFLSNWLISVSRTGHHEKVLVIAEDYATLYKVNDRWPGHAVLVPPAPDAQVAHKFGSQDGYNEPVFLIAEDYATLYKVIDRWPGHAVLVPPASEAQKAHKFGSWGFFNFTSRRPRHLLQLLELGYNVMYNDVDMVWLADPFPYMQGSHDVYFTDDMTAVKPLDHSHDLPPVNSKGRTYICSCMIFLRPTSGAKLVMNKWIEELKDQPWSRAKKANDQPGFNWALMKTVGQVDLYLLPQAAFPTGGLYFKNKTWVQETKGKHVIIHNNYIIGFEKKIKRFRDFGLWLVDDHAEESPLGKI